jgi:phosphoribosylanthranilate isomerase
LAGGLNAENVNQALNLSGATQLDVSSGVEDKFGNKSETKISEFLSILKGA